MQRNGSIKNHRWKWNAVAKASTGFWKQSTHDTVLMIHDVLQWQNWLGLHFNVNVRQVTVYQSQWRHAAVWAEFMIMFAAATYCKTKTSWCHFSWWMYRLLLGLISLIRHTRHVCAELCAVFQTSNNKKELAKAPVAESAKEQTLYLISRD